MLFFLYILFIFIYFYFFFHKKLLFLLLLELLSLILFFLFFCFMSFNNDFTFFMLIFSVMLVLESVLGLSCLILSVRNSNFMIPRLEAF